MIVKLLLKGNYKVVTNLVYKSNRKIYIRVCYTKSIKHIKGDLLKTRGK